VPIRGLRTAKTRLSDDLDPIERTGLVTEMLRRTLVATRDSSAIAGTVVVTLDPAAARMARSHTAIGLVERVPGLNAAIEAGRSLAVARGATAVIVLPADLPAITPGAVSELVDACREGAEGAAALGLRGRRRGRPGSARRGHERAAHLAAGAHRAGLRDREPGDPPRGGPRGGRHVPRARRPPRPRRRHPRRPAARGRRPGCRGTRDRCLRSSGRPTSHAASRSSPSTASRRSGPATTSRRRSSKRSNGPPARGR